MDKSVQYLWLKIDGKGAEKYRFDYQDSGTAGYARARGQYAVHGRLTNVSGDWSKDGGPEHGIISVVGTVDSGIATLYLLKKVVERNA